MKFVGVTACPSGVAHTYMAAEALTRCAKAKGIDIKVETQGSIGTENNLTMEDIKQADAVILTKDIEIRGKERFEGKVIVNVGVSDVIRKTDTLIDKVAAYVAQKNKTL